MIPILLAETALARVERVSMLAKMSSYRFKQWIDGLTLDAMGWLPTMPVRGGMFCKSQLRFLVQKTQEITDLFFKNLVAHFWILDLVEQVKFKMWVDVDRIGSNPSLFVSFPEGSFQKRFSGITVTFRQVPAGGVTHEKEFDRIW